MSVAQAGTSLAGRTGFLKEGGLSQSIPATASNTTVTHQDREFLTGNSELGDITVFSQRERATGNAGGGRIETCLTTSSVLEDF